jgi:ATP-binding cassette subfamily B protein
MAAGTLREFGLDVALNDGQGLELLTLNSNANQLSQGQKQRLCLAREIIRKPDVLVLDEATANLDVESEKLISNWIVNHKQIYAILITGHRSALVDIADKVIRL